MRGSSTFATDREENRTLWEGMASSCAPPLVRLGSFTVVGVAAFVVLSTAEVVFYNFFGERRIAGQGVFVPAELFYAALVLSALIVVVGYAIWLIGSLHSYRSFSTLLGERGLDPRRPTTRGLGDYSDEQLLALRSRYAHMRNPVSRRFFENTFGFDQEDSFRLAPLNALPGTFEMNALRVEWEANLILTKKPPVTWLTESRQRVLPRSPNRIRKLLYERRYTRDSVRELRRRYGHSTDRWHRTVPEGKLFDAMRDYEEARRIQAALERRPPQRRG